jgi:gas vesicle protein
VEPVETRFGLKRAKELLALSFAQGQNWKGNDQASEPEMSEVSQKIVEKLTQLREELDPVLKTVEDACQQFEKMIQPVSKQAKHS